MDKPPVLCWRDPPVAGVFLPRPDLRKAGWPPRTWCMLPLQPHRFTLLWDSVHFHEIFFFSNEYSGRLVATDFASEGFTSKDSYNLRWTRHVRVPNHRYPATLSQLRTPASAENAALHARLNAQVRRASFRAEVTGGFLTVPGPVPLTLFEGQLYLLPGRVTMF